MPLSWNEIKTRATAFSKEWQNTQREEADAKPFLVEFLNIFGISQRRIATFEHRIKKLNDADGYIDLLWKGMLLVEMKSLGKDLNKAYTQAKDYCHGLKEHELPKLIMVCDFDNLILYDEEGNRHQFTLNQLTKNIQVFALLAGYQKRTYKEQDPVNMEAAVLMGKLHDKLKAIGYTGHALELYLVRLLFCLFADDTNIFEKSILLDYIQLKTNEDGSDLAMHIDSLFTVLNTPHDKRLSTLDESLNAFPYVNGKLFEERLPLAGFDSDMRKTLLQCNSLDWGKISPAIFGSLFQAVMDEKARRNLGAHYTSEKNILKLIKPLFLDELWAEFEKIKHHTNGLKKLHHKISRLRFLDPACGCGNFLIIAYRELRLLEIEIVRLLLKGQTVTDISSYFLLDVDKFYGIEYEEFPAQVAQVAMWLIDHQMNMLASETFGEYYVRLPLRKSATIVHGNALRIDWQGLLQPQLSDAWNKEDGELRYDYILGNPPFVGKQYQNAAQKEDMDLIFHDVKGAGVLDYVTAWYIKAAQYMQAAARDDIFPKDVISATKAAFVSTNSISQGEQVGILWNELFNTYKIKIHFAHRTFSWSNEARGNAAVHVVIIGFANFDIDEKRIFEYEGIKAEPHEVKAKNINPYLVNSKDIFLAKRRTPICNVPEMVFGSMPNDGGHFLFEEEEKNAFLRIEPDAEIFFKKFIGSHEFINGDFRWCLWLKDANPNEIKKLPEVQKRIELVRQSRLESKRPATNKLAEFPTLFGEIRQPESDYLAFPEVSSERRKYIPVGFMNKEVITSNKNYTISNASPFSLGILSSIMHMAWIHYVAGRMKSDFSYSTGMVYNNFPWPENPTDKQKEAVEQAAQAVLDARLMFPQSSLADLYDPNTMPPALVKAHQQLDKAVDQCYRPQPFINETKRIEFLFELYDKYTAGMFVGEKKGKKKK